MVQGEKKFALVNKQNGGLHPISIRRMWRSS